MIEIDGKLVGNAQIFSNTAGTHRAVVAAFIPIQLGYGQHSISLSAMPNTTLSDSNDFYTAVLHY